MIKLIDGKLRIFSCIPDDLSSGQEREFRETTGIQDINRLSFAYCLGLDCILINQDSPLFRDYIPFIKEYLKTSESVRKELKAVVGPYMDSALRVLDAAVMARARKKIEKTKNAPSERQLQKRRN